MYISSWLDGVNVSGCWYAQENLATLDSNCLHESIFISTWNCMDFSQNKLKLVINHYKQSDVDENGNEATHYLTHYM